MTSDNANKNKAKGKAKAKDTAKGTAEVAPEDWRPPAEVLPPPPIFIPGVQGLPPVKEGDDDAANPS